MFSLALSLKIRENQKFLQHLKYQKMYTCINLSSPTGWSFAHFVKSRFLTLILQKPNKALPGGATVGVGEAEKKKKEEKKKKSSYLRDVLVPR